MRERERERKKERERDKKDKDRGSARQNQIGKVLEKTGARTFLSILHFNFKSFVSILLRKSSCNRWKKKLTRIQYCFHFLGDLGSKRAKAEVIKNFPRKVEDGKKLKENFVFVFQD